MQRIPSHPGRMSALMHEVQLSCRISSPRVSHTLPACATDPQGSVEGPAAYITGPGPQSSTCHLLPGLWVGFLAPCTQRVLRTAGVAFTTGDRRTQRVDLTCVVWLSYVVPLVTSHVFPSGRGQGRNLQRGAEWG